MASEHFCKECGERYLDAHRNRCPLRPQSRYVRDVDTFDAPSETPNPKPIGEKSVSAEDVAIAILEDILSEDGSITVSEPIILNHIAPLIAERDRLSLELADAVHLRDHWFKTYQHALKQWDRLAAELADLKNNSKIPFDETKP